MAEGNNRMNRENHLALSPTLTVEKITPFTKQQAKQSLYVGNNCLLLVLLKTRPQKKHNMHLSKSHKHWCCVSIGYIKAPH